MFLFSNLVPIGIGRCH